MDRLILLFIVLICVSSCNTLQGNVKKLIVFGVLTGGLLFV